MERKRFSVLFFIKRSKLLKNGEAPVRVRVTYDRLYVELQLKRSVKVPLWSQDKEKSIGKDRNSVELNHYCIDWQDYIILNSTANVDKALYPLGEYEKIHCLLDNDEAGRKATQAIQKEYGWRVRDASHLYSGHKDLNDYLCQKSSLPEKQTQSAKQPNQEEKNKQSPGEKRKRGRRL